MSNGNASAIVKAAKDNGALVFANMENLEAKVELYKTEVTQLAFNEKDFHSISGKKMPTKSATDRIGEACGVQFIQRACRVVAEPRDDQLCGRRTVYRAEAQGKVRMPDGSWRESAVDEYEFDPTLRAMLDKNITELTPETRKSVARNILEYEKVARQRAATGVRLRVIRQLTGMPASFEPADTSKPMVFVRVVQNTDYILKTPEGRAMATAQALGADMSALFGGRKITDNAAFAEPSPPAREAAGGGDESCGSALAGEAADSDEPEFPDDPAGSENGREDLFKEKTLIIEQYMATYKDVLDATSKNGKNPYEMARKELADPKATIETRESMIARLYDWLKHKGAGV